MARQAKALGGGVPRIYDARPDRVDFRDLTYRPPLRSLPPRFPDDTDVARFLPSYVEAKLVLDQGTEGACTGFGLACVANYLLWTRHVASKAATFEQVSPRMFYELAKRYDEWPGTDYEGSSCRGALKGWHKHGACAWRLWPYDLDANGKPIFRRPREGWEVDAALRPLGVYYRVNRESVIDLQAAIVNIGAVYVSASVHDGWDTLLDAAPGVLPQSHAKLPVIAPPKHPRQLGGHAFALVGFNERGFVVQNSWGVKWGAAGFAVLPYDDWVVHGTDAWACALGVPTTLFRGAGQAAPVTSTRWRVAGGRSLTDLEPATRSPNNPADDPWPIDHEFAHKAYEPWSTASAYEHTLATGNDGEVIVTDFTRAATDKANFVKELVVDAPKRWAADKPGKVLKLAVYAHGGLNSEDASIARIRVLAPYFEANGIYPLFLTWKTGVGETIGDMAEDWAKKLFGLEAEKAAGVLDALGDARDRAVETLAHVVAKGLWSEMRDNAARSKLKDHGIDLLARHLQALQKELQPLGKEIELHLVGHSAGSIVIGHFLDRLRQKAGNGAGGLAVKTCTLFAAACSAKFAVQTYGAAAEAGLLDLASLRLSVLSDENEKRDGLPSPTAPAYGKSLLYLVSRALDDARKMPLLGMARAHDPSCANDADQWNESQLEYVQEWQRTWSPVGTLGVVETPRVRNTREGNQVRATHGSFDNNIDVLTETLVRIKGSPLVAGMEWLDY